MHRIIVLAVALVVGLPAGVFAQQKTEIKVHLSVADDTASKINTRMVYAAALRSLGDVVLVGREENPDYVLSTVKVCSEHTCAVAINLASPLRRSSMRFALRRALLEKNDSTITEGMIDSLETILGSRYYRDHNLWAASWGKSVIEVQVRKLVDLLDTRCFERVRILHRWLDSENENAKLPQAYYDEEKWIC